MIQFSQIGFILSKKGQSYIVPKYKTKCFKDFYFSFESSDFYICYTKTYIRLTNYQNPNEIFTYSLVESGPKAPHFCYLNQVYNSQKIYFFKLCLIKQFSYGQISCFHTYFENISRFKSVFFREIQKNLKNCLVALLSFSSIGLADFDFFQEVLKFVYAQFYFLAV